MNIDWNKAPEGATHYYTRGDTPWRDLSGENWKWFSNGKWYSDNSVSSWVDRSSQGFLERRCAELIPRPVAQSVSDPKRQAVEEIIKVLRSSTGCGWFSLAETLYDAGYRKFEIVEEDV